MNGFSSTPNPAIDCPYLLPQQSTHNDQGRVIKLVLAVDVDAHANELLALAQIAPAARQQEIMKLCTRVERVLVPQHAALDQEALLAQLALELMLSQHHCMMQYSNSKIRKKTQGKIKLVTDFAI